MADDDETIFNNPNQLQASCTLLLPDPNRYYSSCCFDPQLLLCNFSDGISAFCSVFQCPGLWATFLTFCLWPWFSDPPGSLFSLFDPCTLFKVLAEAHAFAGSQQMCKQGWQAGSSLSQKRLCRFHQGGPFFAINYSGQPEKRETFVHSQICSAGTSVLVSFCRTRSLFISYKPVAAVVCNWTPIPTVIKRKGNSPTTVIADGGILKRVIWPRPQQSPWSFPALGIWSVVSVNGKAGHQEELGLSLVVFPFMSRHQTPNRD